MTDFNTWQKVALNVLTDIDTGRTYICDYKDSLEISPFGSSEASEKTDKLDYQFTELMKLHAQKYGIDANTWVQQDTENIRRTLWYLCQIFPEKMASVKSIAAAPKYDNTAIPRFGQYLSRSDKRNTNVMNFTLVDKSYVNLPLNQCSRAATKLIERLGWKLGAKPKEVITPAIDIIKPNNPEPETGIALTDAQSPDTLETLSADLASIALDMAGVWKALGVITHQLEYIQVQQARVLAQQEQLLARSKPYSEVDSSAMSGVVVTDACVRSGSAQ